MKRQRNINSWNPRMTLTLYIISPGDSRDQVSSQSRAAQTSRCFSFIWGVPAAFGPGRRLSVRREVRLHLPWDSWKLAGERSHGALVGWRRHWRQRPPVEDWRRRPGDWRLLKDREAVRLQSMGQYKCAGYDIGYVTGIFYDVKNGWLPWSQLLCSGFRLVLNL